MGIGMGNIFCLTAVLLFLNSCVCGDRVIIAARSPCFESVRIYESGYSPLQPGEQVYCYRSSALHDLDDDGYDDVIITCATYPDNAPQPVAIFDGRAGVSNIAPDYFAGGNVPRLRHSPQIQIADIDGDGRVDMLFSEAGLDHPPWTGDHIGIALQRSKRLFTDMSALVPAAAVSLRCYSLAAGDPRNEGRKHVLLPSQTDPARSGLLSWNGSSFDFRLNWIAPELWGAPGFCANSSYMNFTDLDGDGYQDLYLAGSWTSPNHRIIFGGTNFPAADGLVRLPEGPYGHTTWADHVAHAKSSSVGADVIIAAIADFDGNGTPDIFAVSERVEAFKPGSKPLEDGRGSAENSGNVYTDVAFQVLANNGGRVFTDVTIGSGSPVLGRRYYVALIVRDLDLDGSPDIIGHYWSKVPGAPKWGTTLFMNRGDAKFDCVEAEAVFPELVNTVSRYNKLGLGALFPTSIGADGISGIWIAPDDIRPSKARYRIDRFHARGRLKHIRNP